ncbi:MAG: glycogen synthase GlgA [Nitrospira sp.]|nr:glycogen synthase GlgA [Nitrospira sp.]MCP9442452.1 glycogen synthase GlgA [Nitrospira sp.]
MNILIAASEAAPYAKTGGLADVTGALPGELIKLGHRVTLILPGYREVVEHLRSSQIKARFSIPVAGVPLSVNLEEVLAHVADGAHSLRILIVRYDPYFDRPGLYQDRDGDYPDNLERFTLFSRSVLQSLAYLNQTCKEPVDVLHLHDWQTALCAVYLKAGIGVPKEAGLVKTLLTLHNVGYQGVFPGERFAVTGLPPALFSPEALEFYGSVNCLKGGIVFSDALSTVSPTYAKEIMTKEFGHGLEGVLANRSDGIEGIVNGIDTTIWNPETDRHLPARYHASDLSGKKVCKEALQRELGLPILDVPLIAAIGRLAPQKGFDLLLEILPELTLLDVQIVMLGTGDRHLEQRLLDAQAAHHDRLAVCVRFDEGLAHRLEAGADMLVMPSRYEPCGLTQLHSLRYGTVPIVRRTGGLADTVVPFRPSTVRANVATGFHFDQASSEALLTAVLLALSVYQQREAWRSLIRAGMSTDLSWAKSARRYEQVYRSLLP